MSSLNNVGKEKKSHKFQEEITKNIRNHKKLPKTGDINIPTEKITNDVIKHPIKRATRLQNLLQFLISIFSKN